MNGQALGLAFRGQAQHQPLAGPGRTCQADDDIELFEETDDPDSDGLLGGFTEYESHGTDPGIWDTDGDAHGDGDEVAAGTAPCSEGATPSASPPPISRGHSRYS